MAKIGKNILENLTNGMYDDSLSIFREYIQNAADSIDQAKKMQIAPDDTFEIIITLSPKKRCLTIHDNGTGIPQLEVEKRLGDVADSEKIQGENKGFRGIGRLGGIGYCSELRFVTSYAGEPVKTTMIWDAEKLAAIIADNQNHASADEVLQNIIRYEKAPCEVGQHFFQVELLHISQENTQLLNKEQIQQYLSEVAPVDFASTFHYQKKIKIFLQQHAEERPPLVTYPIILREEGHELTPIYKGYRNAIYKLVNGKRTRDDEVKDIQTDIIRNTNGEAIAWIWYAITMFKGVLTESVNPMRCLRLRQFNIEIGGRTTLTKQKEQGFFKEDRNNNYLLGEVHAIDKHLRPNARRDYFNESEATSDFEYALRTYIQKNLDPLFKSASDINSGYKRLQTLQQLEENYQEKQAKGFASKNEKEKMEAKLSVATEKANEGLKNIQKVERKATEDPKSGLAQMVKAITKERRQSSMTKLRRQLETQSLPHEKSPSQKTSSKRKQAPLLVDELSHLNRNERKLVATIYDVIQANLIAEEAEALIAKIQEELKK